MTEEKKNKVSKLVTNRVDLKALTIDTLNAAFRIVNSGTIQGIESSDTMEIVLVTNFGYVTGEITDIADASDEEKASEDFKSYLFASTITHRNNSLASMEEENENLRLTNDSSLIYLKNAVIKPFANPQTSVTFGDLLLFTDQVIGISGKGSKE